MTTTKPRNGLRLSVDEFMELDDTWDKRKMELDDGVLYIMPRPRIVHNFAQNEFFALFRGISQPRRRASDSGLYRRDCRSVAGFRTAVRPPT